MQMTSSWLPALAAALLCIGCASHKEPAMQAVTDVETSLNALRQEAQELAPDELAEAEAGLASMKDALALGDYKAVVDAAPAVSARLTALEQKISAKRSEQAFEVAAATDQWSVLTAEVPRMIAAIESRVQILSGSSELPAGVSAAVLQSAQENLQAMQRAWAEAMTMFAAGNAADAVAKGQAVKEKGREVMRQLG